MAPAGDSSATVEDREPRTPRARLLLDLVRKQPLLIVFNLLLACLLAVALWDGVPRPNMVGWLGLMTIAQLVRLAFWWRWRNAPTEESPEQSSLWLTTTSFLSGLGWGLAGLLLVTPEATMQVMVVSFVIGGMTAGAITTLPSHPPAYYAFILPALLPLAVRLGLADVPAARVMGLMVLVYLGGISLVGLEVCRSLRRAIRIYLDNARRVADLEARGQRLEQEVERSSVQLATIMETVPASLWIAHDPEARHITGSRHAIQQRRLARDHHQPLSAAEWSQAGRFQALRQGETVAIEALPLQRACRGEVVANEELRLRFDDGSYCDELISAAPIRNARGEIAGAVCAGIDISARRQAEEALRLSEQRFRDFAVSASDWLWETDEHHRFTWLSPNVEPLISLRREWHYGKTRWELMAPGTDPEVIEAHRRAVDAHQPFRELEYLRHGPDGDFWVSTSGIPVFDQVGRFLGYRGVGRNISDRKEVEEEIAYLAHHDSLTTLPNRHTLQVRLRQALSSASRHRRRGALLLLDLDYFKEVNDAHGHMIGDRLLRMAAARINPAVREGDTLARFGGDEFAVVVPEVAGPEGAADLAQRLIKLLREPFRVGGLEIVIGASIGVALFPDGDSNPHQLMKRADRALYRAKHENRGGFRFYEQKLDAQVDRHKRLKGEFRRALDHGELALLYQPQLDLGSDRLTGVEALVRWCHPERGLLSPGDFIPAAQANGLSRPLDAWVLGEACRQARAWRDRGRTVRIAINLSPAQLAHESMVPTLEEVLATTGIDADGLELEISESFTMERYSDTTERNLRALAGRQIRLALDDFGTGHSSLASLRMLPVSKIKIDRSFIDGIGRSAQDEALVRLLIGLGHALDKRVLAEGVETELQLEFLRHHGCDEAQGYLIGHPVPAAEVAFDLDPLVAASALAEAGRALDVRREVGGRWGVG